MNGWLIVARCAMDDIPLGLVTNEHEATKAANMFDEKDVLKQARKLKLDTSVVYNLSILEFRGGVPQDYKIITTFDED